MAEALKAKKAPANKKRKNNEIANQNLSEELDEPYDMDQQISKRRKLNASFD